MSIIEELYERIEANRRYYGRGEISQRHAAKRHESLLWELERRLSERSQNLYQSTPVCTLAGSKSGNGDKLCIRATVWERMPDKAGEILLPYSCKNVPYDFSENGGIFYEHDTSRPPIARVMDARQTGEGIDIEAKFANTQQARDTRTVLRERACRGKRNYASIGHRIPPGGSRPVWIGDKLAMAVDNFTLREVSLCRRPANDLAIVTRIT